MRALLSSWIAAFVVLVGRWKARWYVRRLPRVRDALSLGLPPAPPARLTALQPTRGALAAGERSADYVSIPDSARLVTGREAPVHRVASTRILPPEPLELAVFRPDRWDIAGRRHFVAPGFQHPSPGQQAELQAHSHEPRAPFASALRLEYFGLDASLGSARPEREAPENRVDSELPRHRPHPFRTARLEPQAPLEVTRPERFDLAEDGTPAVAAVPVQVERYAIRLPKGRAWFVAKHVSMPAWERLERDYPTTFGETVEEGVAGFFGPNAIGATDKPFHWEPKSEIEDQMGEVKEQFGLRRDLDRVEFDETDLAKQKLETPLDLQSIFEYSGLEFMAYQPEPVEVLRMQLENPPVSLAPFVEPHEDALRYLASALREFSADNPPPVPHVP